MLLSTGKVEKHATKTHSTSLGRNAIHVGAEHAASIHPQ
jgi:hypothetical protein